MPYTENQIRELRNSLAEWLRRHSNLRAAFLAREYRTVKAGEYVQHGFSRRLSILEHALTRTFEILPPDEQDPSHDARTDATIYLQAFVINIFGAIDNLANIWCLEATVTRRDGRPLSPMKIGLTPDHTAVRLSLSQPFQAYLATTDQWFAYLEEYRHALAHRIPLYIPPRQLDDVAAAEYRRLEGEIIRALGDLERYGALSAQQRRLGVFNPLMMHSYGEHARPVWFHGQMICDLSTVIEIGEWMLRELDAFEVRECD